MSRRRSTISVFVPPLCDRRLRNGTRRSREHTIQKRDESRCGRNINTCSRGRLSILAVELVVGADAGSVEVLKCRPHFQELRDATVHEAESDFAMSSGTFADPKVHGSEMVSSYVEDRVV